MGRQYDEYINSQEWRDRRADHFRADAANHRCYVCNWLGNTHLDVHHITYANLGNEAPADLVSLCRYCHDLIHDRVNKHGAALDQAHITQKEVYDLAASINPPIPRRGRPSNPRSHRTRKNRVLTHIRHIESNLVKLSRRAGLTERQAEWLEDVKKLVANAPSEW